MSEEECRTDSICCFQDDSGAEVLRHTAAGLAAALVLCLSAVLVITVAWARTTGRGRGGVTKESPPSGAEIAARSPLPPATDAAAAEAGENAPPYHMAVAALDEPDLVPQGSRKKCNSGSSGEEQRTTKTESIDGRRHSLEPALVKEGCRGQHHTTRATAKQQQFRRSASGVSIKSYMSAESLNDMPVPGPPSPASTVAQVDINRLRSLLDTERSRRVAAESALSGVSWRVSGLCTPTSIGGGGGGGGSPLTHLASPRSHFGSASDMGTPSRAGAGLCKRLHYVGNAASMHPGSSRGHRLTHSSHHKFPSARAVEAHALEASANAAKWARSAMTRAAAGFGGGDGEGKVEQQYLLEQLPSIVTSILVHLFACCRAEVDKRLTARVDGLRTFLGGGEVVQLGSGADGGGLEAGGPKASLAVAAAGSTSGTPVGMAPDTKELLYSELRRRHKTISGIGRKDLVVLSARVLSRALKTEERKGFGRMLVHLTWSTFEPVVRSYLALFVESALQQPQIEFEDAAGKEELFDREKHRELARFSRIGSPDGGTPDVSVAGPGLPLESNYHFQGLVGQPDDGSGDEGGVDNTSSRTCCVVFPAVYASIARWPPSEAAMSGVIVY